jgi:mannose-6-phosphate isomerase-like protein (cupin superfamily)
MRRSIIAFLGLLAPLQLGHRSEQAFNNIPRDDVQVGLVSITGSETLTHPFPEILYVVDGELDWVQGTNHFTAPAGTAILAPAGTAHTLQSTSGEVATLAFYRWAPGGEQATLHRPSTMIEPVEAPPEATPEPVDLRRYQSGTAASERVHAHIDDIDWTTNWTYSEELWKVYRYKPLVREALAQWRGIARSDVRMGLQELDSGAAYPAHHHPSPEIYVVLSGEARWTVGERSFAVEPGSAVYTPPDTTHRIVNTGATRLRWLYFWWAPNGDVSVFE